MSDLFIERTAGWQNGWLPRPEQIVLVKSNDGECPIWLGFHDGKDWRNPVGGAVISEQVVAWQFIEDAGLTLDQFSDHAKGQ